MTMSINKKNKKGENMITEGHHYFNNETDFWTLNENRVFLELVKSENNILDIGCGKGTFLKKLADKGISCDGIDFSKTMIDAARKNYEGYNINLYHGNFITYDFKKKYDCIISNAVLEHVEDDSAFIRKIEMLLNPNGKLILLTSAHPWLYSVFDESVHHYRRYGKKQLHELVKKNKFIIVSTRYWDVLGIPYLLYARLFKRMLLSQNKFNNKHFNSLLDLWFRVVENNIRPPFGLNIIIVARKVEETKDGARK